MRPGRKKVDFSRQRERESPPPPFCCLSPTDKHDGVRAVSVQAGASGQDIPASYYLASAQAGEEQHSWQEESLIFLDRDRESHHHHRSAASHRLVHVAAHLYSGHLERGPPEPRCRPASICSPPPGFSRRSPKP